MQDSHHVIAVGGSGQHISLMLTRLAILGCIPKTTATIIDADAGTPVPAALMKAGGLAGARLHPLGINKILPPCDLSKVQGKYFRDLFLDGAVAQEEKALFDVLFDTKMAETKIDEGMFGRPSVGSCVFADGATEALKGELEQKAASATNLYVCGSIAGGTGAGILRGLIHQIKKTAFNANLYGIFLMPWFDLPPGGVVDSSVMQLNALHGLDQLFSYILPRLTRGLLLGGPEGEGLGSTFLVKGNEEARSLVPFAAAFSMYTVAKGAADERQLYALVQGAKGSRDETWFLRQRLPDGARLASAVGSLHDAIIANRIALQYLKALIEHRTVIHQFYFGSLGIFGVGNRVGPHFRRLMEGTQSASRGDLFEGLMDGLVRHQNAIEFALDGIVLGPGAVFEPVRQYVEDSGNIGSEILAQAWRESSDGLPKDALNARFDPWLGSAGVAIPSMDPSRSARVQGEALSEAIVNAIVAGILGKPLVAA